MDIHFVDPEHVPQPRDKTKIEKLAARPYPDGWRVRVNVDVTPFQERPSLEVQVITAAGKVIAQLSIIETMHHSMEFTVHVRGLSNPNGDYTLTADLYYEDRTDVAHHAETPFTIQV
jgi:hypothetical protein